MTTKEMAEIIIDALVSARLTNLRDSSEFDKAVEIVDEEIRVRLSLGDDIILDSEQSPIEGGGGTNKGELK